MQKEHRRNLTLSDNCQTTVK